MLPNVVPKSRIMVYNYDSKWHSNAPRTRLQICGEELVRSIHNFRNNNGMTHRPILLIGHSLGGNVIQHVSPMAWLSGA
jgi:triacylglycerol esterase/lipase EstA (alpha/beta hydrolase family)